jgi:PcfJ-like protein
MTLQIKYPVELLRDGNGIYGIGLCKEADIDVRPEDLILRRDHLTESKKYNFVRPVLQMIAGGFRHGMFSHTSEEHFRQVIHHGMLRRAGLAWPPPECGSPKGRYWSSDRRLQIRNRQIYHGLRKGSLSIVNRLIGQALEESADREAVKLARRFKFHYRYDIYCAASLSPRVLQIVVAFPALALAIFGDYPIHEPNPDNVKFDDFARQITDAERRRHEARDLIEAGAPLRTIADLMGVPMAFRKIKPGAIDFTLSYIAHGAWDKRLVHAYMPDSLPRMKLWLNAILRSSDLGPDFVEWVAKHSLEIGGTPNEVLNLLYDLKDWVRACNLTGGPPQPDQSATPHGENFVVRPFSPDMSLKTVTKLSADWHEAVASNMSGPSCEFPEPWCSGGESCGYGIFPIVSAADLYREGHLLHHCVGAQGHQVQAGEAYFYSIRKDNEHVATLELIKRNAGVAIGQLRGSCNSRVSREVERAVGRWLRSQREFRFLKERKIADGAPFSNDVIDDEVRF